MTKRSYGDGGIDQRGENSFRLRYRVGKQRYSKTFTGTLAQAKVELRRLLRSGDVGQHVAPDRMTVEQWCSHWLLAGCPNAARENCRPPLTGTLHTVFARSCRPTYRCDTATGIAPSAH